MDNNDKTMKVSDISDIRDCEDVKEQLSGLVEQERDNKRVSSGESVRGYGDGENDEFDERNSYY